MSDHETLRKRHHAAIIDIYDWRTTGDYVYMVMEYCDGTLARWLREHAPETFAIDGIRIFLNTLSMMTTLVNIQFTIEAVGEQFAKAFLCPRSQTLYSL